MMVRRARLLIAIGAVVAATAAGSTAVASGDNDRGGGDSTLQVRLSGFEEDPLALSTTGSGTFRATVDARNQTITFRLTYSGLEGALQQAHIHIGNRSQTGNISVFLCTNLGNGPVGTQACPAAPATVTGTLRPADVIGPVNQGVNPGEFSELVTAIRTGTTYVNVHSTKYPGGEIRAQLDHGHH